MVQTPLRHSAATPWLDEDLHCCPFWCILKEAILLSHDPKTQVGQTHNLTGVKVCQKP